MTRDQMIAHILAANAVGLGAAKHGHHPFGAVLVGPDDTVLKRQGNIDTVHHAETELARRAAVEYSPEFLWTCTLASTAEPCAMCTGTLYWANIGRLIYGFEEWNAPSELVRRYAYETEDREWRTSGTSPRK